MSPVRFSTIQPRFGSMLIQFKHEHYTRVEEKKGQSRDQILVSPNKPVLFYQDGKMDIYMRVTHIKKDYPDSTEVREEETKTSKFGISHGLTDMLFTTPKINEMPESQKKLHLANMMRRFIYLKGTEHYGEVMHAKPIQEVLASAPWQYENSPFAVDSEPVAAKASA